MASVVRSSAAPPSKASGHVAPKITASKPASALQTKPVSALQSKPASALQSSALSKPHSALQSKPVALTSAAASSAIISKRQLQIASVEALRAAHRAKIAASQFTSASKTAKPHAALSSASKSHKHVETSGGKSGHGKSGHGKSGHGKSGSTITSRSRSSSFSSISPPVVQFDTLAHFSNADAELFAADIDMSTATVFDGANANSNFVWFSEFSLNWNPGQSPSSYMYFVAYPGANPTWIYDSGGNVGFDNAGIQITKVVIAPMEQACNGDIQTFRVDFYKTIGENYYALTNEGGGPPVNPTILNSEGNQIFATQGLALQALISIARVSSGTPFEDFSVRWLQSDDELALTQYAFSLGDSDVLSYTAFDYYGLEPGTLTGSGYPSGTVEDMANAGVVHSEGQANEVLLSVGNGIYALGGANLDSTTGLVFHLRIPDTLNLAVASRLHSADTSIVKNTYPWDGQSETYKWIWTMSKLLWIAAFFVVLVTVVQSMRQQNNKMYQVLSGLGLAWATCMVLQSIYYVPQSKKTSHHKSSHRKPDVVYQASPPCVTCATCSPPTGPCSVVGSMPYDSTINTWTQYSVHFVQPTDPTPAKNVRYPNSVVKALGTHPFTFEWLQSLDTGSGVNQGFWPTMLFVGASENNQGFRVQLDPSTSTLIVSNYNYGKNLPNNPDPVLYNYSSPCGSWPLNTSAWAHIAIVYDGVKMNTYINGVRMGQFRFSFDFGSSASDGYVIEFGSNPNDANSSIAFAGSLANVRFCTSALYLGTSFAVSDSYSAFNGISVSGTSPGPYTSGFANDAAGTLGAFGYSTSGVAVEAQCLGGGSANGF